MGNIDPTREISTKTVGMIIKPIQEDKLGQTEAKDASCFFRAGWIKTFEGKHQLDPGRY